MMQLDEVLDVMQRLFIAAQHPDIADVRVYSGAQTGIAVKDVWGGSTYLAGSDWKGETPVDVPAQLPPPRQAVQRITVLAVKLLDAARPAQFQAWRLVALPDLGPTDGRGTTPTAVSIRCADGTNILLRATRGSSQMAEPAEDPHTDWQVPVGITV